MAPATRSALLRPLLIAVALAAVAAAGLAVLDLRSRAADAAQRSALAAAQAAARDLFSYDDSRLDQDVAQARSHLVPELAEGYDATTAARLGATARASQAVVTATVPAAGLVSLNAREAVTLLLVDQRARMVPATQPAQHQSVVRLSLRKTGGRWKVSEIATL